MNASDLVARVRTDLVTAVETGAADPEGPEVYQLAIDLLVYSFPTAPVPSDLEPFSLLVGFVVGSALEQCKED